MTSTDKERADFEAWARQENHTLGGLQGAMRSEAFTAGHRAGREAERAEADDWKDDPATDERWNAGADYVLERLCAVLGVDPKKVTWDAATETLEGDVDSQIHSILGERAEAVTDAEPVAEIRNRFGDPEAFAERELVALTDISKMTIGTKLYTQPPKPGPSPDVKAMRTALERIADPRNHHFAGDAQAVAKFALAALTKPEGK